MWWALFLGSGGSDGFGEAIEGVDEERGGRGRGGGGERFVGQGVICRRRRRRRRKRRKKREEEGGVVMIDLFEFSRKPSK